MTLTDYAKYLLSACGRRFTHLYQRHYLDSTPALPSLSALLTYLRTQTASIFTQIKARGAVHPLSGLPATETLATLPTALATLSTRKVDVGTTTHIDDGVSLQELFTASDRELVTELKDPTSGWDASVEGGLNAVINAFPNMTKMYVGCQRITANIWNTSLSRNLELHFDKCTYLYDGQIIGLRSESASARPNTDVYFDELEDMSNCTHVYARMPIIVANRVFMPKLKKGTYQVGSGNSTHNATTTYIYVGGKGNRTDDIRILNYINDGSYVNTKVSDIEIGQNTRQILTIISMQGLTRENIRTHIIDKLADNNYEDDGVTVAPTITITLGSTNLAKLTTEDIAVANAKNYTLA